MNPDAPAYVTNRMKRQMQPTHTHPIPQPAIPPMLHSAPTAVPLGAIPAVVHANPTAVPPVPCGSAVPSPQAPSPLAVTKLSAVAKPFQPKVPTVSPSSTANVTPHGALAAPPPPPPTAPPPQYSAASAPSARLNVGAVPYTPTKLRSSQNQTPTNSGTPTFPETPLSSTSSLPAPPLPVNSQPSVTLNASSLSREGSMTPPSTPCSPSPEHPKPAAPSNPFEKSKLTVPDETREAPADPVTLNVPWCLWADDHPLTAPSESKDKFQLPVMVQEVGDLQQFWRLWWHSPNPSTCTPSWTYSWFRKGITPVWEDPRNKNGGAISIIVYDHDKMSVAREVMDDAWMIFVLAVAGESLTEAAAVNGLTLKIRPHRAVQLQFWTNVGDETRLRSLAEGIRSTASKVLPSKQTERLEFFSHDRIHTHAQKTFSKKLKALEPNFTL
mmetsp:Transcript_23795/g.27583  ORF Transcript_23795/g.27583 Transcript_23795/m.27583 type:complete len:440 (+) Transcript_23795:156-1475(+)